MTDDSGEFAICEKYILRPYVHDWGEILSTRQVIVFLRYRRNFACQVTDYTSNMRSALIAGVAGLVLGLAPSVAGEHNFFLAPFCRLNPCPK